MTLTTSMTKIAAIVAAASLVVGIAFMVATPRAEAAMTSAQIQSIISLLQSFGADSATIANVQASLTRTAPVLTTPPASGACVFTTDLTLGSKGAVVTCLQTALIANGYSIPAGATGLFGPQTQAAVIAWQKAKGITPAAGYFGAKSRAAFGSTAVTTPTTPAGTGLTIAAGTQPANALSPQGATRVPFTRITLTAGSDGDVVVNSVQVQRVGTGQNAAFAGVTLIDEATGKQLGVARSFNSNHQASIGEKMTIPRGTTKTFLVAGNMAASLALYAGEAPGIAVVGVNTTATVTGTLPITGAFNTNNATLTVGTATLTTSNAISSNSNQTKEIGTTAFKQTGLRVQAGSAEDLRLLGVRWNQTGSVSTNDLGNVMTFVGGTGYPTTVSADGKYYDTNLGAGVIIGKGNQVDIYVQYDIIGSNSSNRTVMFDIDRNTDIFSKGEIYGFGISPAVGSSAVPTTRGTLTITNGTPFVFSTETKISGASITSIAKANAVPAQNIAINLPNQPLGGYVVDIKGENITVQSTVMTIASTTGAGLAVLTSVTIVDQNGAVVAGPVDATYNAGTALQTVTFTDTITYKTGLNTFTVRGKVASTIGNGKTYAVTTVPSSGWTTVRGETTGNTVSLSANGPFTMNTMTVKAGAVTVGPATSPATQIIVPGGTSVLMANIQFDATQSGEDVRFATVPARLTYAGAAATELTSCQIFDGATALNTGSNTVNPSAASVADNTFTLDNPVTVAKGTVKTLGLRCNVSGSATDAGTFLWLSGTAATAHVGGFTFSGATSGTTITGTAGSGTGPTFTIGTGSVTVTIDAASPGYLIASAGTANVTNGVFKFRSANENISLTKLGLTLTNTASSTSGDLVKATVWDGATKVGEAYFVGSATTATSTFTTAVTLVRDTDKSLTVKLDLADVGTSQAVVFSGRLVAVDYLNAEGVGAASGTTFLLGSAAGSTAVSGTRVFKSFPTFAADTTLASTGIADGRLMRFKVTADAKGPIGITNFAVSVATTTATVTNITVYGFTDSSYSTPISGVTSSGNLQATDDCLSGTGCSAAANLIIPIGVTTSGGTATAIQVPAGETRYFELRGIVTGATSGASVTSKVLGSSAFPSTAALVAANPLLAAGSLTDTTTFIWSPNSTTTVTRSGQDWTSGFGVNGLPSGGLISTRSQ